MKPDALANASAAVRALNPAFFAAGCLPQSPDPKPAVCTESLGQAQGTVLYTTRCLVRVTSYRCGTPVDPDGMCAKYFVDALRYAKVIPDDRQEDIDYEVRQRRVKKRKEEHTTIEVIPL